MNVLVADYAAPAQYPSVGEVGEGRRSMSPSIMAFQAKSGHTNPQHAHVIAPVSIVTVQATFAHGGVLPQEWPSLLSMAAVAFLVHAVVGDEIIGHGPVHIVAT